MCLQKPVWVIYALFITLPLARGAAQNNSKTCILPQHPENGRWSISGSKSSTAAPGGQVGSGTVINVQCNGQYKLTDGPSLIECNNGKWKTKIGKCLELCPPIVTAPSRKVTCNVDGKISEDCSKPQNGTVATISCSPFYENAELNRNPFRVCINGKWSQEIPDCTPVCGSMPKQQNKNKKKYYPWNAAIFIKRDNTSVYKCTGTLINERTILTAAHCFTDPSGKKESVAGHTVTVGKAFTKYDDGQDKDAQYSELEDVFFSDVYKGSIRKYFADIAVLITRKPFTLTERVQPACIDLTNKYFNYFENPSPNSTWIAGPLVREYYPSLKNTTEIQVTLVTETTCYTQLSQQNSKDFNYESYYSPADMYCSEYINSDKVFNCLVDHGVGLVVKNDYNDKYYVIGVLNSFPSLHRTQCDNKRWTLYTRVSQYVNLINKALELYAPISRTYFQTSCGIKSVKATVLIVNGAKVIKGDYPWQTALYQVEDTTKNLICGGSLLNQRVILTAAHCVTDTKGNILPKESYAVAVGKYYRKFDDPRDTEAQYSSIKNIFVPRNYKGEIQNYMGDIAILITENSFRLTKNIQPICMDWDGKYESQFLKPTVTGYVTGWGFTRENQSPSEELKELAVPYIEQSECEKNLPQDYEIYLTDDKLCFGFLNEGQSACHGDSGGGLVYKNNNDGRYYLGGIVSLSPRSPTGGCDSQQYTLYTRVSSYVKNFVLEKVQLYWA